MYYSVGTETCGGLGIYRMAIRLFVPGLIKSAGHISPGYICDKSLSPDNRQATGDYVVRRHLISSGRNTC